MKFAKFVKIAAVAGVMIASMFGQSLSANAMESITMGYTKVEWQYVSSNTRFAADLTVLDDGSAAGTIQIHRVSNVTLKRGVINATSGRVICDRDQPVMNVEGTYYEEIGGTLVARGPAHTEVRKGGGGDIIVFDIVGVASQNSTFETHGELTFPINPCR